MVRAGHQLAGRNHVTLDEIAKFPLAGPRLPARLAEVLPRTGRLGHLSEDGRYFIPVIECATPRSMIDVVAASNAVCMIWPEHCAEQLKTGAVVELPFRPPWLRVRQGIMYRRNKPLPRAALAFRNVARLAERASISKDVRPGDDFYRYVNEGWLKTAAPPPGFPFPNAFVDAT